MRPFDETLIDLQTDSGATTTLWLLRDRLSARKEAERKQRGERRGEERRNGAGGHRSRSRRSYSEVPGHHFSPKGAILPSFNNVPGTTATMMKGII